MADTTEPRTFTHYKSGRTCTFMKPKGAPRATWWWRSELTGGLMPCVAEHRLKP